MSDLKQTPLYALHQSANGKLVDFGGWALPVNYGSQIEEHHAVRNHCGVFDVSHMTVSDITGPQTLQFLSHLLANDINKVSQQAGKALYSCMLNENGGVIDDLIVYYINDQFCRMVTNASTNEKDMAWLQAQSMQFDVTVQEKPELALVAIQGPKAIETVLPLLDDAFAELISGLKRFEGSFDSSTIDGYQHFVGRTGYTGEDGLEFIVNADFAQQLWNELLIAGVQPCGLGARDTLRLEAGMALYGNDLDEDHTPLESGLKWTVSLKDERDFVGKPALLAPAKNKTIGLVLLDRGVLRGHQAVMLDGQAIGEITSGTFSPTLEKSIAIARISSDADVKIDQIIQIEVRNKQLNVQVVKYPFI